MIKNSKEDLKLDLESKKEIILVRLKSIEKQEQKLKEKTTEIQQEILKNMDGKWFKMLSDELLDIIEGLDEIKDDTTVPKNIRLKIGTIMKILEDNDVELSIKISKAQQELDDISEDSNIQAYTRTQLWNVVSLLETI